MPETRPGCRLTAGKDRRSSMETGNVRSLCTVTQTCFPSCIHLCSFSPPASRSLHLVTRCHPSAVMTWCTTGLKVWRSVYTGMCVRGRPAWQTSRTPRIQKTESPGCSPGLSWRQSAKALCSSRVGENDQGQVCHSWESMCLQPDQCYFSPTNSLQSNTASV